MNRLRMKHRLNLEFSCPAAWAFPAFQPGFGTHDTARRPLDVRIVRGARSNAGYWSGTPPTSGGAEPSAVKNSVPCAAVEKARWPVVPKLTGTAVE
jgi:hypothetical protein